MLATQMTAACLLNMPGHSYPMPLHGCRVVSSGPLRVFQLAYVTLPEEGLFAHLYSRYTGRRQQQCNISAECCCDPGSKISGFSVQRGKCKKQDSRQLQMGQDHSLFLPGFQSGHLVSHRTE